MADRDARREAVKTVIALAGLLISLALVNGCADAAEQRLRQVQEDLEQVLRTELLEGDIRMQRTGDHLTVVMTERLLFDAGSPDLKPDGMEALKRMAGLFKTGSFKEIRVAGHGDTGVASDRSNRYFEKLALSKARATQTVRVLEENGVDSRSVFVEWYGDIRPIASNSTEAGRQMNRRIEIVLYAGAL